MARRIRVIEHLSRPTFGQQLEERARELVHADQRQDADQAITASVRHEIALTLDHLDRMRRLHENLRRNLLRHDCYLSTEILQREPRGHQVDRDYRLPERDRLRDRLRDIEAERRRLAIWQEEQLQRLQDRLLASINRYLTIAQV